MSSSPRSAEPKERPDEYAAHLVVAHNLDTGVQFHDDGTEPGMVDYLILDGSDAVGALEVGRNTSEARTKASRAWERHALDPMVAAELTRSWSVSCLQDNPPTFAGLQQRLVPVFRLLEAEDRSSCDVWSPSRSVSGTPEHTLAQLGIQMAYAHDAPDGVARIWISVGGGGSSAMSPDAPLEQLESWLASDATDPAGLRRKLAATGLSHRHAFVWVDLQSDFAAHRWLDEDRLPDRDPVLPTEVTAVWLTNGARGWHWSPAGGWKHLDGLDDAMATTRAAFNI